MAANIVAVHLFLTSRVVPQQHASFLTWKIGNAHTKRGVVPKIAAVRILLAIAYHKNHLTLTRAAPLPVSVLVGTAPACVIIDFRIQNEVRVHGDPHAMRVLQ